MAFKRTYYPQELYDWQSGHPSLPLPPSPPSSPLTPLLSNPYLLLLSHGFSRPKDHTQRFHLQLPQCRTPRQKRRKSAPRPHPLAPPAPPPPRRPPKRTVRTVNWTPRTEMPKSRPQQLIRLLRLRPRAKGTTRIASNCLHRPCSLETRAGRRQVPLQGRVCPRQISHHGHQARR